MKRIYRIYKFELELKDQQKLLVPDGAKALTAQLQHGKIMLWCEVDDAREPAGYTVDIRGTGHETSTLAYLSTVQQGPFVWHVFTSMERSSP